MEIGLAGPGDLPELARLLWSHASPDEQARQPVESFTGDLGAWWSGHRDTHLAFVARPGEADRELVGMAWLALVPRVPRPGALDRRSGDIQSVFVVPEQRGQGIGSALVRAATEHGQRLAASRVTVHSGRRAVPLYERLGFASSRRLLQSPVDALCLSEDARSSSG